MTTLQEAAMRQSFETWAEPMLGDNPTWKESGECELAWQSWQAALAQQGEPQPVAMVTRTAQGVSGVSYSDRDICNLPHGTPLYTAAPAPQAQQGEQPVPIYQFKRTDGSWIDQTKSSYDYNVRYGVSEVRIVYTAAPAPQQDGTLIDEGTKPAPQAQPTYGPRINFANYEVEFNRLHGEIQRLAVLIWSMHYRNSAPDWQVLGDAYGALSQISNMVAGLQSAQPVAPLTDGEVCKAFGDKSLNMFNALLQDAQDMAGIKEVK